MNIQNTQGISLGRRRLLIFGGVTLLGLPDLGRAGVAARSDREQGAEKSLFDYLSKEEKADVSAGTLALDLQPKIQAAFNETASKGQRLIINAGKYRLNTGLLTRPGLDVEWDNEAWFYPHQWSPTGSTITNVGDRTGSAQRGVSLHKPQLDGRYLPYGSAGNDNALGFARGISNVQLSDVNVRNFKFNWIGGGGAGGKAVNFESGVSNSTVSGLHAENCGIAMFVQGMAGNHPNGASKAVRGIEVDGVHATNCDAAFVALGIDSKADLDGDAHTMQVNVGTITFRNCGHAPSRPVKSDFQKSGAIVIGEGQNINIEKVFGQNDANYPSAYPTDGTQIGSGLSGPIGAVVWGWGRNIHIGFIEYRGNCDSLIRINRARALGEDASPTGKPRNCFNFEIGEIRHYGTAKTLLALDSNKAARVAPEDVSMKIGATTGILTRGICDESLDNYANVYIAAKDAASNMRISGQANKILRTRNKYRAESIIGREQALER